MRSAGGFRLYSEADARRVRRMQAHLARGLPAAEAARAVLGQASRAGHGQAAGPDRVPAAASELSGVLRRALDAFDEPTAQAVLDRLVSDFSLTAVLRDVVLPISPSSGSAGSGERPASPRSTSPATSSAGGSPGWPGAGGTGRPPRRPGLPPGGSFATWR